MTEDIKSRLTEMRKDVTGRWVSINPDGADAAREIERLKEAAEIEKAIARTAEAACAEWAETSQRNYQRAKKAEAEVVRLRAALESTVTHIENDAESTAVAFGVSDWTRVAPQSAKIVDQARVVLKGGGDG